MVKTTTFNGGPWHLPFEQRHDVYVVRVDYAFWDAGHEPCRDDQFLGQSLQRPKTRVIRRALRWCQAVWRRQFLMKDEGAGASR